MGIQPQAAVRSKKLGVLIKDARLAAHKNLKECAQSIGVTGGILRAWEDGRRSPSLPELEMLAFSLQLPIRHFWSSDVVSDNAQPTESVDLEALTAVRQRLVGALLRQMRENAGLTLRDLAEKSGLSISKIKTFELGKRPVPVPELEALVSLLGGQIELLYDRSGPIGQWMNQQNAIQEFLQLPAELQEFASKPYNRPYLELALKLSNMSTDKLRALAENLLDITY
jgi:transcriptional regulator with XRE-family HTH domain